MFRIVLHIDDIDTLYNIKNKLEVGQVRKHGTNSALFIVSNISDINNIILPIFEKFPLLSLKALDLADFFKCY
jgi:hypothetical protein